MSAFSFFDTGIGISISLRFKVLVLLMIAYCKSPHFYFMTILGLFIVPFFVFFALLFSIDNLNFFVARFLYDVLCSFANSYV